MNRLKTRTNLIFATLVPFFCGNGVIAGEIRAQSATTQATRTGSLDANGALMWFNFENPVREQITDNSGTYSFRVYGNPISEKDGTWPTGLSGHEGKAWRFDGVDDFVSRNDDDTFDPGGSFSVLAVVTPDTFDGTGGIIGKGNASEGGWRLIRSGNNIVFLVRDVAGDRMVLDNCVANDQMTFVVATYEYLGPMGSELKIYCNDRPVVVSRSSSGRLNYGPPINVSLPLEIGRLEDSYFAGQIHHLAYFGGTALSAVDAASLREQWLEPYKMTLSELDELSLYLDYRRSCADGPASNLDSCLGNCAVAASGWEKNDQPPVDRADLRLSYMEFWDDGRGKFICRQGDAIVPKPLCDCLADPDRTPEDCQDQDGDGLLKWQEDEINTSDSDGDDVPFCRDNEQCGFQSQCNYRFNLNRAICEPRACGSDCTAFHLEKVVANNHEVILHVYYDYSPVPATVLDLHIQYPAGVLSLLDARPLPQLLNSGKGISKSEKPFNNGEMTDLRLVVLGANSTAPVPQGAIIELVFRRLRNEMADIAFSKSDYTQQRAMAPNQGAEHDLLANDSLWGPDIHLAGGDSRGAALYYSFDDSVTPSKYAAIPSGKSLCDLDPVNCNSGDVEEFTKDEAQAEALQRGKSVAAKFIPGVQGQGVFFDGRYDHLELPVHLNGTTANYHAEQQDFSFATWFYAEGDPERQVLFSHNNLNSEETRFGLLLDPLDASAIDIVWFEGPLNNPNIERTVARGIPVRTWTHLGMSVNASSKIVRFYINGEESHEAILIRNQQAITCPEFFETGQHVQLKKAGKIQGGALEGKEPQEVYYASRKNNLFGIELMDLDGLISQSILRDGQYSYKDPNYSPITDKILYSSNVSGNFEIWIANGDGSNPRQLTRGFGDTFRGIFARHPKWNPTGRAFIFESNVYNADAGDNNRARTKHLYYLEYDPMEDRLVVADGKTQLDYEIELKNGDINQYRLTKANPIFPANPLNHFNLIWLKGRPDGTNPDNLGEVVFSVANQNYENRKIHKMEIPTTPIKEVGGNEVNLPDAPGELELLAGYYAKPVGQQPEKKWFLYKQTQVEYVSAEHFQTIQTVDGDKLTVTIIHTPVDETYAKFCWDYNGNQQHDSNEDQNGDGNFDVRDCYPYVVGNLYLKYENMVFDSDDSGPGAALVSEDPNIKKEIVFTDMSTANGSYIRVEVQSPYNDRPLAEGAEIAKLTFDVSGASSYELLKRTRFSKVKIRDMTGNPSTISFDLDPTIEMITSVEVDPNGEQLLLAGIQNARPVLLRTISRDSTIGAVKISKVPMTLSGLSWFNSERYYPCNWVGAFRDPYSRQYSKAFRGGLDEVVFYNYVREAKAFASDAQRGAERLEREGLQGVLPEQGLVCNGKDSDCPAYYQCIDGQCELVGGIQDSTKDCDPFVPDDCARGQCTLLPLSAGGNANPNELSWVCATECDYDRQCFEEACLNGPCRYCQQNACIECRKTEMDYGTFQIRSVEGCPDSNDFYCVEGSCQTECYSFEDGTSKYLCTDEEYCKQGRCVLLDWDWADFGSATFSGLGETTYDGRLKTVAASQLYPIEVKAFGVSDYLHPPEILVEGKGGGPWFELGRIVVYNKTLESAEKGYTLYTPYPISSLRLRLITPPYENLNAAATGLMSKDEHFCHAQAKLWAESQNPEIQPDYAPCYRRSSGSRFTLGYRATIPWLEAAKACGDNPCGFEESIYNNYLYGGQPAVIVTEVKINSSETPLPVRNKICSYEGNNIPVESGRYKQLYYGDASLEQSNQKNVYYPESGATQLVDAGLGAFALLNCNYAQDDDNMAYVYYEVDITENWNSPIVDGAIRETANSCLYDNAGVYTPCYEWTGAEVHMDCMSEPADKYNILDFSFYSSFGYEIEQL